MSDHFILNLLNSPSLGEFNKFNMKMITRVRFCLSYNLLNVI